MRPAEQTGVRARRRKAIPSLASKRLFQEADSRCPFCGVADVAVLEIHHLDEDPANNETENLIVVCGNCHSRITRGEISAADVHTRRMELFWTHSRTARSPVDEPEQSVTVNAGSVSGSIIANNVTLARQRSPRPHYPPDSIGADTIRKGYVDYLIHRYYDYRRADASYGSIRPFSHAEIHTSIQRKFKAKTFYIHVSRFAELCAYVTSRVDGTVQGKRNRAQGTPNCGTYEEYRAEQAGHGG